MFKIYWDPTALALSVSATLGVAYYVTALLHRRYDRQFGWSFMLSGVIAFLLPLGTIIGLPVYAVSGLLPVHWSVKLALLAVLSVPVLLVLMILKARLLSKIFPAPVKPALSGETL